MAYNRLRARVLAFVKPADILEEIWTGEFIDLEWDIHRYRRMKTHLMTAAMQEAFVELLSPIEDQSYDFPREFKSEFTTTETLVRQWYWGSEDARKRVNELLSSQSNLTMETVKARAFAKELPNIMRVEQLISNSEARRNATLREIERHRETFGRRLREASDNIQDAEYETVVPVERTDRKN